MRLRPTLLALALAACAPSAPAVAPATTSTTPHAHGEVFVGVHRMLAFGEETLFLSHLPLYRAPHDWQMILQARLVGENGADPMAAYAADRRASGEPVYTLEPERLDHGILAQVAPDAPVRFRGTLFRGHFERGGTPLLRDVLVEVTRVTHRRRLDGAEADAAEGRFLLFGAGREAFLAHRIAGAPDFDQVVAVELPVSSLSQNRLAAGVEVAIAGHAGGEPLREDAPVKLRRADGWEVAARVGRQLYLEHGDLATVP